MVRLNENLTVIPEKEEGVDSIYCVDDCLKRPSL